MKKLFITETGILSVSPKTSRRISTDRRRNLKSSSLGRRTSSVPFQPRTGRFYQDTSHRDNTPGPCGYFIPSDLISGKAQRFGKPEVFDLFQTKQKDFIPAPDSYFNGGNEKFSSHFHSEGFTFPRSERKMFNQTSNTREGISSFKDTIKEETKFGSFSMTKDSITTFKDKESDPVGPGYYKPTDTSTTRHRKSRSFQFSQRSIDLKYMEHKRKPKNAPNLYEKNTSRLNKKERLTKLFKQIYEKSKLKTGIKETSHRGFQKFRHLHLKQYDKEHYLKIFLGKQSMFKSDIIMKNIEACEPSLNRSTHIQNDFNRLLPDTSPEVFKNKQRIQENAKKQNNRRQEVLERYTNIISNYHDKSEKASQMRKTTFDIRMSAHSNWQKSKYCIINDKYLTHCMKKAICEDICAKFMIKKKIRYSSNKLCRWFIVMMKAAGKFLISLREIRKRHATIALGKLLVPLVKRWKLRKLLQRIREDKELAFIDKYNSQCKNISEMILITSQDLRRIKNVFKKLLFRRKLVQIITHFHWFLLENAIFSYGARRDKKANLDIIKIRKEWEGDINFIVPYEVRNMYIRETKFYLKIKHLHDYHKTRARIITEMKREEIRRTSTNFFL
ncbi:unnamed protein product [Moneuplotes crassus]|uniref:Uncharacterized protein n=1 Tax=Euplotes crassus TaxID=5936 RepID=A0AAD1YAP1_EUPCR|nr:unnamed protein product [Moneuplotes crassus]